MTSPVPVPVRPLVPYWPKEQKLSPKNGKSESKWNYGPKFTRYAMPWFETYWHSKHRYPSNQEIIERFGCSLEALQQLHKSKFFLTCLESRGIAPPNSDDWFLSDKQIAAISVLTNFNIVASPVAKVADLGVTEEELNGWYQNPNFQKALADRADNILGNVRADATTSLARLIKKENFNAIKFYFEITGQAQTQEAINVKQAMQILIEAVQKHVKDPEVLSAIAAEVQSLRSIQGL